MNILGLGPIKNLWNLINGVLTTKRNVQIDGSVVIGGTAQAAGVTDTALTANAIVVASAAKKLASVALGTAGQVLTSNGAGAAPTMQAVPAGTVPVSGTSKSAILGGDGADAWETKEIGQVAAHLLTPKQAAQGVNMIYGTTGGGIAITNTGGQLSPGIGNFAVVFRLSWPDYTPATTLRFYEGTPASYFAQVTAGQSGDIVAGFRTSAGETAVTFAGATLAFANDAAIEGAIVFIRESALVDGSAILYVNGAQVGSTQVISATATLAVTAPTTVYLSGVGAGTIRTASTNYAFLPLLNFAPTAAEIKTLYDTQTVPESWKWGSQTDKLLANYGDFAVDAANAVAFNAAYPSYLLSTTSNWTVSVATKVFSAVNGTDGSKSIRIATGLTVGQRYLLSGLNVTAITSTSWQLGSLPGSGTGETYLAITTTGVKSVSFVAATTDLFLRIYFTGDSIELTQTTAFTLKAIGPTAAYLPEGVQQGKWINSSSNQGLDATWPAVGASLVRPVHPITIGTNLLDNSRFGVFSNADAAGGIATLTFGAGATAAPTAGLAVTGATSGATGKVMSVTITGGTFAGSDAAGTISLGAVTGTFRDNESVAFTGGTVVVNGDSAIGVFNDPMNDDGTASWAISGAGATIVFDTDHYNLSTASVSSVFIKASSNLAFTSGKLYVLEAEVKDGTASGATINLRFTDAAGSQHGETITTTAAWVKKTWVFECVTTTAVGNAGFLEQDNLAGANFQVRNFSVYEHTPGCTAADALGPDGWQKDTTVDLYREFSGTNTKEGSFFSLKFVPSAIDDFVFWPAAGRQNSEWIAKFKNRTVTIGMWVKTSVADSYAVYVNDGSTVNLSSYHTGGGTFEWLEKTFSFGASPTSAHFGIWSELASNIAYISQPMLVYGTSCGSGNYAPKPNETIYFEKPVNSQLLNAKTGFSDTAATTISLEADSRGVIPKGIKAAKIHYTSNDFGSATANAFLGIRPNSVAGYHFVGNMAGVPSDVPIVFSPPFIPTDSSGDWQYTIDASGANTFDIPIFTYNGAQLR